MVNLTDEFIDCSWHLLSLEAMLVNKVSVTNVMSGEGFSESKPIEKIG